MATELEAKEKSITKIPNCMVNLQEKNGLKDTKSNLQLLDQF